MKLHVPALAKIAAGIDDDKTHAQAVAELVKIAKTEQPQARGIVGDWTVVEKNADRTVRRRVISTEVKDRSGDRMMVDGWDLTNYHANPVILLNHDRKGLSVGKSMVTKDLAGRELFATAEAPPKGVYPMADVVWGLVEFGTMKASSVGFRPTVYTIPKSEGERKELGLGPTGVFYRQQELTEWSVVTVPDNQQAVERGLKDLVDQGHIKAEQAQAFDERVLRATERDILKRLGISVGVESPEREKTIEEQLAGMQAALERVIVEKIEALGGRLAAGKAAPLPDVERRDYTALMGAINLTIQRLNGGK